MRNLLKPFVILGGLTAGMLLTTTSAQAQFVQRVPTFGGFVPSVQVEQRPGFYLGRPGGTNFNPFTGSVYRPWAGTVSKPSGNYFYVPGSGTYTPFGRIPGSGIYQNPWSGNQYQPGTGLYIRRGWGNW